jgi:hypothetical protein
MQRSYLSLDKRSKDTSTASNEQSLVNVTSLILTSALQNQAHYFYEFQLQSYRQAVDSWIIIGLRNNVVKDIRKMIGKMIWDAREEAAYSERKQSARDVRGGSNCLVQ